MNIWSVKYRTLAGSFVGALLVGQLLSPAQATNPPLPPSCDPTKSVSMPACPSVLLGEVGDVEHPTISLPDLVPDVTEAWVEYEYIDFDGHDFVFGPASVTFDTRAQNLGQVPIDLQADDPRNLEGSTVSQCISWTTNLVCRQRTQVGGFTWHEAHRHYHFDDFASYELRTLNADGTPDFQSSGLVSTSPKVSFCLVDSDQVRENSSPVPRYTVCNPYQEGISPGYTDIYDAGIEGQYVSLNGRGNGRYALVVSLNTAAHVHETNTHNNRIVVILNIESVGTFNTVTTIVNKYQL